MIFSIAGGLKKTNKSFTMKPINSKERYSAYYKVIGLFICCLALAILLGFSTMNVTKVTDYATRKQLEELQNSLTFQDKTFLPNIEDATKKLKDLPDYKTKALDLNATKGDIETSLKKIMGELKGDENDQKYAMYKNIVDIYFALESAYDSKFKLEEKLEAKEGVVQIGDVDLQRAKNERDELDRKNKSMDEDNKTLTEANTSLNNNIKNLQSQLFKLQNQLGKCRDSLNSYIDINKGLKQQINKLR
jgi:chromosome segregation ATPase